MSLLLLKEENVCIGTRIDLDNQFFGKTMIEHLFVYGTLAPGRPNAHILADVSGSWEPAVVKGFLRQEGWGADVGYPGIIPSDSGNEVEGFIFTSEALSAHWQRLDEFEGDAYLRVQVSAKRRDGSMLQAYVYALRSPSSDTRTE